MIRRDWMLCLALLCVACGGSSGGGGGGGGAVFTFDVDGVAQDDSSGATSASGGGIVESNSTAEDGSPLNLTNIHGSNTSTGSFIALTVPVWPPAAGTWTCPSQWEVDIIYGPPSQQAYYAGQNGEINPNYATAPCTITITSVGSTVVGTFSATVGNENGNHTITNGSFSIPYP